MDGDALLKTRRPLVFKAQLCAHSIEFAHGSCRVAVFERLLHSWERENRSEEETDLPSAAALSAVRQGTGCKTVQLLDIFIGCFYLSILTGEKSLGGDSLEDSAEHHVVDFRVLSASHVKEPTSNLWRIPWRIEEEGCVLNSMQCSIRCGPVQSSRVLWGLLYAALLRSGGTRQSCSLPLLNHYLLIHFTQPGVIMHGPVNGYLSMLCIYLIISRSGGEDKSADCVHCGAFSAGGET